MPEIKIRNIPSLLLEKIELQAKENGMKREAYIRSYLETLAARTETSEEIYISLIMRLLYVIEENSTEWMRLYLLLVEEGGERSE